MRGGTRVSGKGRKEGLTFSCNGVGRLRLCHWEEDGIDSRGHGARDRIITSWFKGIIPNNDKSFPHTAVGFVRQFRFLPQRERVPHDRKQLAHLSQVLLYIGNNELEETTRDELL